MRLHLSLKQAWLALVLFAGLAPVTAAAVWFGWQIYQEELHNSLAIERKANEALRNQIVSEVKRLKTLLAIKSDTLDTLIKNTGNVSNLDAINAMLRDIVSREKAIHEVMLLSSDVRVISAIDNEIGLNGTAKLSSAEKQAIILHFGLNNPRDVPEVVIPSMGRSYIGAPKFHEGNIVFSMAIPVGDPVRAIIAVLVHVDELWQDNKRNSVDNNKQYWDYIVDGRGALITFVEGNHAVDVGDLATQIPTVRAGLAGKEWSEATPYTGIANLPVYGAFTQIPMLNWSLISEISVASVTEPIWKTLAATVFFTLTGILMFLAIVIYLTKRTIEPLQKACAAIDSVARGDFDTTLEACGIDELDKLSAGFNSMLSARESVERDLLNSQMKLASSEALFRGVIESSTDGVVLINMAGDMVLVNQSIVNMSGYAEEALLGSSVENLLPARFDPHKILKPCSGNWRDDGYMCSAMDDIKLMCNDGKELPVEIRMAPVVTDHGQLISIMFQDISLRKQAEEKIKFQAHYDALTRLPNRFLALDRLSQLIKEGYRDEESVAILFLDLDDFKKVNDSLGHEVGDKLLVEAASRLRMSVRKGDTVGRLGGDEFIVLLGGLESIDDVQLIVENVIDSFRNAFKIDGREFMLTLSVGISMFPGDGDTGSELLRNADSAMYHSKNLGRNTYSFYKDEMNLGVSRRLALEEQLHGALERCEFKVHYQPKVDLADGRLVGAEALLRWDNPALGSISPDEFIPIAERTGMIVALGEFVLSEAVDFIARWQRGFGASFRMAVNLSPRQFRDPNLITFIRQCLQQKGIPPECLEMEITEGVLMSGHAYIDEALASLKAMNISLAMDDFGTGYSSLSYLRKYPFDVLKIDRSFINEITYNAADLELVQASIALAQGLRLSVVAEGIETEEQLAVLRGLGCDYGQGYLFGKPMSAEDLSSMFHRTYLKLVKSSS